MKNNEELKGLLELIESHSSSTVIVKIAGGRTNQFFRVGTELRELVIHQITHNIDFEPVSEKDLKRRYNVDGAAQRELLEALFVTIEQNRRLSRGLQTFIKKDFGKIGSEVVIDCMNNKVTKILGTSEVDVTDHSFWENTMRDIFVTDEAYNVMRKHLMLFVFTNYTTLPTIIFTGDRGVGKNVYTEMLGSIFVAGTIRLDEDLIESQYNSWMKNILIIADEAMPKSLKTYKMLKSLANHDQKAINEKYMLTENFNTNATVVITSNDDIPIYTKASELANNPKNNQFYIYNSPVKSRQNFDTELVDKIKRCTVAYIKDVLANEWEVFKTTEEYKTSRYHMIVPITESQKVLFESNQTDAELFADDIYSKIMEDYNSPLPNTQLHQIDNTHIFVANEYIMNNYVDNYINIIKMAKMLNKSKLFKSCSKKIHSKTYRGYIIEVTD